MFHQRGSYNLMNNNLLWDANRPVLPSSKDPTNGCVVLGVTSRSGNRYATRFHIKRNEQLTSIQAKDNVYTWCPWLLHEGCCRKFLAMLSSPPSIIFVQICVLLLSLLKECLDLRRDNPSRHFNMSVSELVLTCYVLLLRIVPVWWRFYYYMDVREDVEYFSASARYISMKRPKKWLACYTAVMILFIIIDVIAFICLHFYSHLGWTMLSSNLTIFLALVMHNCYMEKLTLMIKTVREDHHKTVLYECILMFADLRQSAGFMDKNTCIEKIENFCKAFLDTPAFAKPRYITCPEEEKPTWNLLNVVELQSLV